MSKPNYFMISSGAPFWLELSSQLERDFELAFCLTDDRISSSLRERFQDSQLVLAGDLKFGLFDSSVCEPFPPNLRKSSEFILRQTQAMYSFERCSVGGAIAFLDRSSLVSSLADFFWSIVQFHKPRFAIATEAPHTHGDLVLTGVLEAAGIDILHFQQNGIVPSIRPVLGSNYERVLVRRLLDPEADARRVSFLSQYRPHVDYFLEQASTDEVVRYEKEFHSKDSSTYSGIKSGWRRFYIPYGWLMEERRQYRDYVRLNGGEVTSRTAPTHAAAVGRRWRLIGSALLKGLEQSRNLRALRQSLARESVAELPDEFATFFLQFEPEKTSVPDGGTYGDQLAAIRAAARALSGKMVLAVREHPTQLTLLARGFRGRSADFYRQVAAIPNVCLLDSSVSRAELFARTRLVFTLTGTVGLEARARGIPVVTLGHAWYLPLEGVFSLDRETEVAAAVEAAFRWSERSDGKFGDELWDMLESDSVVCLLNPSAGSRFKLVEDDVDSLAAIVRALFSENSQRALGA